MHRESESILRNLASDVRQRIFHLRRKGGRAAEEKYLSRVLKTLRLAMKGGDEHGIR